MKKKRSVFSSGSEERVFQKLDATWSNGYLVCLHLPVRDVLGWGEIGSLPIAQRDRRYLQTTDFDFVVCAQSDGEPLLAVEFDGLSRGYSKDGRYLSSLARDGRRRHLDTKLAACEYLEMPMVIVSYEEALGNSGKDQRLTVLDAIIGMVISGTRTNEELWSRVDELACHGEEDANGMAAGGLVDEINFANDLKYNPVVRRTIEMRREIEYGGEHIEFAHDRDYLGYVGARSVIFGGLEVSKGRTRIREYMSFTLYLRAVSCLGCDSANLVHAMADYLLLTKAIKKYGTGDSFWTNAEKAARWVER